MRTLDGQRHCFLHPDKARSLWFRIPLCRRTACRAITRTGPAPQAAYENARSCQTPRLVAQTRETITRHTLATQGNANTNFIARSATTVTTRPCSNAPSSRQVPDPLGEEHTASIVALLESFRRASGAAQSDFKLDATSSSAVCTERSNTNDRATLEGPGSVERWPPVTLSERPQQHLCDRWLRRELGARYVRLPSGGLKTFHLNVYSTG